MSEAKSSQSGQQNPDVSQGPRGQPTLSSLSLNELGTLLLKYVTIAVGVGALAFALKVLLLVGMDAQVAAAIVADTSSSTAIQMLLTVAPGIGLAAALVLSYQAGRMSKKGNPENHSHSFMIWPPLLLLAVAVMSPALLMFGNCVVLIPLYGLGQAFLSGRMKHGANYLRVVFGLVVLLSIAFFYATDMWLPKERIHVGSDDYLVYVTSESDDTLVGYFPANKAVLRVKKDDVSHRQYCAAKDAPASFASQWKGTPNLPECPGTDKPFPFG